MEERTVVLTKPHTGGYTIADIDRLPEGFRAELYDGQLVMNASPNRRHQNVAFELAVLLRSVVPTDTQVVMAPFDWQITNERVVEPDLLVLPKASDEQRFTGTPLLVAEVLSPSTRVLDLTAKLRFYEEAAVPVYLIVDPDGPSVVVNEYVDGKFVETGRADANESLLLGTPFDVEIAPERLLG